MTDEGFEAAWRAVAGVQGWLTRDQARRIWTAVGRAGTDPAGRPPVFVEIGSFRGRSMIVAALAAGEDTELVAIDPHAGNDRGPGQWHGTAGEGQGDHEAFWENLGRAGVAGRVRHVRSFSSEAHGEVEGSVDVLYIDGAHRYGPASADIRAWGARVAPGGVMLIHDAFSSVGVTMALMAHLVPSGEWTYEGRSGSMVQYRRMAPVGGDRMVGVARQLASLGWFARNLAVKTAIVARLRPLARVLGHDGETWPY